MFCNQCGHPLKENETICPNCGTEVKKGDIIVADTNRTDTIPEQKNAMESAKKKKVRIGLFAGIGVCVAAIVLLVLNFSAIMHTVRRTITSPASYYRYVEKQNTVTSVQNLAAGMYAQNPKDWNDFSAHSTTTVEMNDYVLSLISALTGLDDLSWLRHMGLTASVTMQEDRMQTDMAWMLGEKAMLSASPLISFSMLQDASEEMVYMQVPQLSEHYIGINAEQMEEEMSAMQDVYEILPNEAEIHTLAKRYSTLFFSHVKQVTKSKEVLQTEGLTKEVYAFSALLDAETRKAALLDLIAEAKQDEILLTFLKDMDNLALAGSDLSLCQEFLNVLEDWETELTGWDTEAVPDMRMTIYVDGHGKICGRDLYRNDVSGENKVFSYALIQSKGGLEFTASVSGEHTYEFIGVGTVNRGAAINGRLHCSIDGEGIFKVDFENFKMMELVKGKLSGTMKISLLDGLSDVLGLDNNTAFLLAVFADYYLQIDMKLEKDETEYVYSLRDDSVSYITITSNTSYGKAAETMTPPSAVILLDEEAGLEEWIATIDFEKFKAHLHTTPLPEEWISLLDLLF